MCLAPHTHLFRLNVNPDPKPIPENNLDNPGLPKNKHITRGAKAHFLPELPAAEASAARFFSFTTQNCSGSGRSTHKSVFLFVFLFLFVFYFIFVCVCVRGCGCACVCVCNCPRPAGGVGVFFFLRWFPFKHHNQGRGTWVLCQKSMLLIT